MKRAIDTLLAWPGQMIESAKVRKGTLAIVTAIVIFQLYFVRELIAAELLFAGGFAVLLFLGGIVYLAGVVGERGLDWAEAGLRATAEIARRGYASLEEVSRKPFRAPRSESAQ
jgi:hypothetical protein